MITEERLIEIVTEALDLDEGTVTIETQAGDVAEWDSLGHLSILQALQDKLDEDYIESESIAGATSLKEILQCLNEPK
tara:strand:- start:444 stop:677 length:234 start_codon:yes stop_codon:yes gene_type:complete